MYICMYMYVVFSFPARHAITDVSFPPHAVEGTLEHNRDISTSLIINRHVRARTSP